MSRLICRVSAVMVSLSVFAVCVTVLPLSGQSDPSHLPQSVARQLSIEQSPAAPPSPAAPVPVDRIFLPFAANAEMNANGEYRPPSPANVVNAAGHTGHSAEDPPAASRNTFVTDQAPHLDHYFGRSDLPNGELTFPITITVPVLPQGSTYEGRPHVTDWYTLVDNHTLPR